jgi:phosphatidylserine/phosphatidylglycerophosphate/cardiolipin synthase-like enzyme
MEFIQNTTKGSQLNTLNSNAVKSADSVLAAVAYVTDSRSLIDTSWKEQKPLTLFARYDYSGPVSDEVLRWFLSKSAQSANYELRFVADIFHPKVIWWKEVGVYIGSANLTMSAWGGNVEAGIFLSEEELDDNDMRSDLEQFFETVRELSHPLNKEIADEMVATGTGKFGAAQTKAESDFEKNRRIPRQHSMISITKQPANVKNRATFLTESEYLPNGYTRKNRPTAVTHAR